MTVGASDSAGNPLADGNLDCRNDSTEVGNTEKRIRTGATNLPEAENALLNSDLACTFGGASGSGGALSSDGTMATGAHSGDGRSVPTTVLMSEPLKNDTKDASGSGSGGVAKRDGTMVTGSAKDPDGRRGA